MEETYKKEELPNELKKDLQKVDELSKEGRDFSDLIDQVEVEFKLSTEHLKPKKDEWKLRLRLLNNQKRNKEAIGDPLMFTTMQTVVANLYNDSFNTIFVPRESGDEIRAKNLTKMYEYDYSIMQKDKLDYDWIWDSAFYGRGLLMNMEFNRTVNCPIPQIISPLVFERDPRASTMNGDILGRNGARFCGREVQMSKQELKSNPSFVNVDQIKPTPPVFNSLVAEELRAKDDAQNRQNQSQGQDSPNKMVDNCQLLQWFTFHKGKRVEVILANNRKLIIRYQVLKNQYKFPVIDRPIYQLAHDWDGVSIPDMTEDKQRARAVIQNLGLKSVKSSINPMYLYNSSKIKNRNNLKFGFNKFVPVNGDVSNAMTPIQRQPIQADAQFILNMLDTAAQKATASPQMLQGQMNADNRTATETELVSEGANTRQSLSSKIFGWSEKEFARDWYMLYKHHFADGIDKKQLRITGALGYQFNEIRKDDIITNVDPDVKVESKNLADYERQKLLQGFTNWSALALTYPDANKIIAMRELGRLNDIPADVIDAIVPQTIDELDANDENKVLDKNQLVKVMPSDDHNMHIWIHNKANDTAAKYAHMKAHRMALLKKKENPELFPAEIIQDNTQPSENVLNKTAAPIIQEEVRNKATRL